VGARHASDNQLLGGFPKQIQDVRCGLGGDAPQHQTGRVEYRPIVHFKDSLPFVDNQSRSKRSVLPEGAWFPDGPIRACLMVADKHLGFGQCSMKNQGIGDDGHRHAARLTLRIVELAEKVGNVTA
jgi:hypothetical protein